MVACFDLSKEANNALEALMQTGQFPDTSEAVSLALVNYQVIHRAVSKGAPVVAEKSTRIESPATPPAVTGAASPVRGSQVPELFFLNSASLDGLNLQAVPGAAAIAVPPSGWLFGQYNKFLPVKVSCRGLLNLLRKSPGGVPLAEAIETISTEAWVLGDYLYMLDQSSSRSREEALAAAFPVTAGNGAGSRIRFANQFIGDLRQPKRVEDQPREIKFNGLPGALRFIACTGGKTPVLNLTKPGGEFAALSNPVLDGGAAVPDRKFSEAEIQFLLSHLRHAVPEEISAYVSTIDAVTEGANTPDELDKYLCRRFQLEVAVKAEAENQITQTFLTTQRTGAVSRMVDLGLLGREKTGLRVTYLVTPRGSAFQGASNRSVAPKRVQL